FALLFAQVALGGWVSTNYAVLACSTFPDCNGSWWPDMQFAQGFEIWRPLGMLSDGNHISFAALTAIHYVHRLAAYVVIAAMVALIYALRHQAALASQRKWLMGLMALQFLTGLSNVVLDWPLVAAVLHTGGAAALVTVMTWALAATRNDSATALHDKKNAPHGARSVAA
ncbi:MAG: COX15/CtaA family protein, partial [Comamonas sp.]|nr:COX15/CtaA family protein [Candidatus Comamonas equi]